MNPSVLSAHRGKVVRRYTSLVESGPEAVDRFIARVLHRALRRAHDLNASNEARAILHVVHSFADELGATDPRFDRLRFISDATEDRRDQQTARRLTTEPQVSGTLTETATDHVRGPSEGGVALVVYGDYECPYTRAAYRNVQRLERRLGDRLRLVFRHFPLSEIHPHAQAAAEAAEAAAVQGYFWEMHDVLLKRQRTLEPEALRAYAQEVGLELELFERQLADREHAPRIAADVESGTAAGVHGTPTLFLGGRRYGGSYDARELGPAIERLADEGRVPVEEGR